MQSPINLSQTSQTQHSIHSGKKAREPSDRSRASCVNKIFTTLRVSYPAWYNKYYGSLEVERLAKRIWLTGIGELTKEQVNQGLQRMVIECEYPPNLHEFVKLCKRVDGLPCVDNAWSQALLGQYSHSWVKLAAQLTGIFELLRSNYNNAGLRKKFEYHYNQIIAHFLNGEPLRDYDSGLGRLMQQCLEDIEKQSLDQLDREIALSGINKANARSKCLAVLGLGKKI